MAEELLDVLTAAGQLTGISKPRSLVHKDGDYHRAVHVWIFAERTEEILLQRRADCKDSWPSQWDISSAGHISAGDTSLMTARRELEEELGVKLPEDAFELIFECFQECVTNDGAYINNGFNDVYLVTTLEPIPPSAFSLQESEVSAVKYIHWEKYRTILEKEDPEYVPYDVTGTYGQLFSIIEKRYKEDKLARSLLLQKQLDHYAPIKLYAELTGLSKGDMDALVFIIKAAQVIDEVFYSQEFELWKNNLRGDQQEAATGFFTVIRRPQYSTVPRVSKIGSRTQSLCAVPYSHEYQPYLHEAANFLKKAEQLADSPSLKQLLKTKAEAFLSNDYFESDIAWMQLDSKLDVTIGPYETYEDALFGFKATFEAFIGVRDDVATSQLKLFGDRLQDLENNLPMEDIYKSKDVVAAHIRVIRLIYNAGDVKGPQTVAFNLPNDERIVKERGTSMVMLKNISEAKFEHILKPIAEVAIREDQKQYVDFESFFTHTICHECCHGIGPHSIRCPSGKESTVRLGLLPRSLERSMYVSFLAGCFRSVRFGLEEAHGKGQALQFNWLFEKGAFVMHSDGTFSVNFTKVEDAVESLSRKILFIQATGDKSAAGSLLKEYAIMTRPLKTALERLEKVQIFLIFAISCSLLPIKIISSMYTTIITISYVTWVRGEGANANV
ncbi:unnamed protein product [Victoria cruziana]